MKPAWSRSSPATEGVLDSDGLGRLVTALVDAGYTVIAPVARDGALVHDEVHGADELPRGTGDVQEPGRYRLRRREDDARFGYARAASSWKAHLHPPEAVLWSLHREPSGRERVEPARSAPAPRALLGVRPCELAAIAVQDRVLLHGRHPDATYADRHADLFIVAVNCGDPAATCFCTSMGTGPRAGTGYDLALTEILDGGHRFLVETGSEPGRHLLGALHAQPVTEADRDAATAVIDGARSRIRRRLDAGGVHDLLLGNLTHPRWQSVAERCLACGNCTMVCPTCFCTDLADADDVQGTTSTRTRQWASCFSLDFAYLHGGSVRPSIASRYRQWMTHKLATWWDQFGTSGCVGCGGCITWCPVGIDITEEVAAIAATDRSVPAAGRTTP